MPSDEGLCHLSIAALLRDGFQRRTLYRFFLRRTADPTLAEDLVQDTFVRMLGRDPALEVAKPKAFMFQIAANLLRDHHRQFLTRGIMLQPDDPTISHELVDRIEPERIAQAREILAIIVRALNELPTRRRDILILNRLERMTQREIALAMGISLRLVEKEIARALLHLAKRLPQ